MKRFALWAGITGNVMLLPRAEGREDFAPGYFRHANLAPVDWDSALKAWPGFAVGMEF